MNITTFPKLKQRHIILWRFAVWFVLTFWALPKRVILRVLGFPLGVAYNICVFVKATISAVCETSYKIGMIFVRYFQVCRYLVHAVAEEGSEDGKWERDFRRGSALHAERHRAFRRQTRKALT